MHMRRCRWQQVFLCGWFALFFLIATTVPRFGTLWHTHGGGRYTHTHPRLSETTHAPSHEHHNEQRLTVFWHVHEGAQRSHAHPQEGTTSAAHPHEHAPQHAASRHADPVPALTSAADIDLHRHFFEESLPVGFLILLAWFSVLGTMRLATYQPMFRPLRYRRTCSPRAPPARSAAHRLSFLMDLAKVPQGS
jgi:hypothetical protein